MKNTIIYALIFTAAFVGITYELFTLNNKYVNIFQFDFRNARAVAIADSLAAIEADSTTVTDSMHIKSIDKVKVNEYKEDLAEKTKELNRTSEELKKKDDEILRLKNQLVSKRATEREEWLKATIKLYEEMDVAKATEILKKLPEDEARDIVYSMKKKKAAEILSSLDIETVKRLTRSEK